MSSSGVSDDSYSVLIYTKFYKIFKKYIASHTMSSLYVRLGQSQVLKKTLSQGVVQCFASYLNAVSYTHMTLPTILRV